MNLFMIQGALLFQVIQSIVINYMFLLQMVGFIKDILHFIISTKLFLCQMRVSIYYLFLLVPLHLKELILKK